VLKLGITKSVLPSEFKSPAAMSTGNGPASILMAERKLGAAHWPIAGSGTSRQIAEISKIGRLVLRTFIFAFAGSCAFVTVRQ